MADGFICKDQHYELISSIEQEKTLTTTAFTIRLPAQFSYGTANKTFQFRIGGPVLYYIIESISGSSTIVGSQVEINKKYVGAQNLTLGSTSQNKILSDRRYRVDVNYSFAYNPDAYSFGIQANAYCTLYQGSASSDQYNTSSSTIIVLVKYKLES